MSRNRLAVVWLWFALAPLVPAQIADGDAALARFDLDTALRAYRAASNDYVATWKLCRGLCDKATLTKDAATLRPLVTEAEKLARQAVTINPSDAKGHLYLAIAIGKLGQIEGGKRQVELSKEVKSAAEKAIALNPNEDLAYHVLGVWHREMANLNWMLKKFAELLYGSFPPASLATAEKHLAHAARLAPQVIAHRVELGITQKVAGKKAEAKQTLSAALQMPRTWVTDEHYLDLAKRNQ